jgi:hypothetical protein
VVAAIQPEPPHLLAMPCTRPELRGGASKPPGRQRARWISPIGQENVTVGGQRVHSAGHRFGRCGGGERLRVNLDAGAAASYRWDTPAGHRQVAILGRGD